MVSYLIIRIFAIGFVPNPRAGRRMKRESGANPGQSRCCEFQYRARQYTPHATVRIYGREGDVLRNESEDLQDPTSGFVLARMSAKEQL